VTTLPAPFIQALADLEFELESDVLGTLSAFLELILSENPRYSLIGAREPDLLWTRHILDAIVLARILNEKKPQGVRLVDVGSGNGFPGLVLGILDSRLSVALVESTKKAEFLDLAIRELGLGRVTVFHERAEVLGRDRAHRGRYDLATARAVGSLDDVLEYLIPLLGDQGLMVTPRGPTAPDEVEASCSAAQLLGADLLTATPYKLPGSGIFHMVCASKARPTPDRFPRPAKLMAKKSLSAVAGVS